MHKVYQNRFGDPGNPETPPGNCWTACLASILDLELYDVPDEMEFWKPGMTPMQSWRPYSKKVHGWLHSLGYILIQAKPASLEYEGPTCFWDGYCLIFGPSPRYTCLHSVVGTVTGQIVHDPFPEGSGLAGDPDKDWTFELLIKHFK